MAQPKTKFRPREVVIAVALGGVAAVGAGAILFSSHGHEPKREVHHRSALVHKQDRQNYEVGPFEGIAIVGPQNVVVKAGKTPSVQAEGAPEILAQFEVVVDHGKLQIRPTKDFDENDWSQSGDVTYFVTTPKLDEFVLGGTGDARIDRIRGKHFEGTIAGTGELQIATMNVDRANFNVVGAGNLVAAGSAKDVKVKIAGAGDVNAKGMHSKRASLDIAGAGDVEMTVTHEARIAVLGAGDVDIAGGAKCSLKRFGVGSVTCNGVDIGG